LTEDNPVNQMIARKLLIGWGAHVVTADNGKEALQQLEQESFDIVLMDIQMPEMNGYEAAIAIRNHATDRLRTVPIMAMTAHATQAEKDRCFSSGIDDYISKPFDPEQLKNQIGLLANRKQEESLEPRRENLQNIEPEIIPISGMVLDSSKLNAKTVQKTTSEMKGRELTASAAEKIDISYIRQISGGSNEFVVEMIELFLSRTQDALDALAEELKKENWKEVRQIAHRIKPTFRYVGSNPIQQELAKVEQLTLRKPDEPEEVRTMIANIQELSRKVFIQLESELATLR
jgi:CheY-like chemotaxis protein